MSWFGRLSPRRRVFTAGIAVLAAVGVTAGAVLAVAASSPAQRAATGQPAQDQPGPVLLVPGYGGKVSSLSVLAGRIRAAGRQARVVRLPGNGTGSLVAAAAALDAAATQALRHGAPSVDVIGYSAGGVAVLIWARDDGGDRKARRVVTLGSPFHGARIAADAEAFLPGACPVACQQLTPGSSLLRRLDASGVPARPRWLSLWTTDDRTVTPPASARLPGAVNVPVQSVCPGQRIGHSQLPASPAVAAMVLAAIGTGPVRPPTAADCRG